MIVFAFLPFIFTLLVWRWMVLRGLGAREGLLAAYVVSGGLVVLSTEILSLFRGLDFFFLLTFWSLLVVAISALLSRLPGALTWSRLPELSVLDKILLGLSAFLVVVIGFIGLYAPPNTWDSMTYHMARVGYWQQNNSVMNYPTSIMRQLVFTPFAEYVILHLQILSGDDRLANMVQWSAMVVSAIGVSLIAHYLGAVRAVQIASALMVLTLPIGILEGSSTQNDYVVAGLLVCVVCFVLKFVTDSKYRWIWLTAGSAGLAAFTKPLGLLYAVPVILIGLFFSGADLRRKFLLLLLSVLAVAAVSGAYCFRLTQVDPNMLTAMKQGANASMEKPGVAEVLSNMLRNTSTELALPLKEWNAGLERAVIRAHQLMKIDILEPRTTAGSPYRLWYFLDEDYMPNPWHMLLILAAAVLFWLVPKKDPLLRFLALVVAAQALLFWMTNRWHPFITRYHLPMFVMAMPLIVVIFDRTLPRKVLIGLVTLAFLAALHPLVLNNTRRIFSEKSMFRFSREQNYFMKHPGEYELVGQVSQMISGMGCRDVGLKIGADTWDYTWRVMLAPGTRIEHVGVDGVAAGFTYPNGEFHPCFVVDMVPGDDAASTAFNGRSFVKAAGTKGLVLYMDAQYKK
ncbi:MAG: glycosyltransferase family 39 protein [Candidatus Omnitrophica bacterium]|nr:glycosyltransferase family 39 protein [Candidatus Omnitrophota bacterium]